MISRREFVTGVLVAGAVQAAPRPEGVLIDSHVHLYGDDTARFPFSSPASKQRPYSVEQFVKFAVEAKLDHAVIVHPEPYQDDHRYLEYSFAQEPFKGFFKGTCLLDPTKADTPSRMRTLVKNNPGRMVALRIHETHAPGTPSSTTGNIRDRDLKDPQVTETWRAAHELGLAIQMHLIPHYAPQVAELVAKFRDMPVILDHLARAGQGTAEEFEGVLRLSKLPKVYIKFSNSGVTTVSKQPPPHLDAVPLVKRVYEAFGPDRMIWGELGTSMTTFERQVETLDAILAFAPEKDRAKIRGLNAKKLFGFK